MFKQSLRTLLMLVFAATLLVGWGGTAQAFLSTDGTTPITIGPGDTPDYLTSPNWAYTKPIRKFIDNLPELNAANNLGQSLPIATADIDTYPGSDYYIIKLVQFTQQMHSDLGLTTLRGYVQMHPTGGRVPTDPDYMTTLVEDAAGPQYLGPIIIAQKDKPVRILFINGLDPGAGGDLFIPVDQSIMGSGDYTIDYDPVTKQPRATVSGKFTQNRAELHLHGGRTPWISDGTPHQWIVPAGDTGAGAAAENYPQGVSVVNVPDMPDPGFGAQTYYWTNQQSARFMFYHDHAWGITRLNVYVGEAAGYVIQDQTESDLVAAGLIPAEQIPLVIQDKTFVDGDSNNPTYVLKTDPTWRWGTGPQSVAKPTITEFGEIVPVRVPDPAKADLWWPHVYMPAQNPFDITGIAPMGRWAYGPYFWPATNNKYQPIPNPYFNPSCDAYADSVAPIGTFDQADIDWNKANINGYTTIPVPGGGETPYCQPPEIPSSPNPSWGAEAFMDTPTVNGTAYPVLTVGQKPYRFRVLNAAHDRFFNLSIYKADTVDALNRAPAGHCDGVDAGVPCSQFTEVAMVPASGTQVGFPATYPADARPGGVPDWNNAGPDWVQVGTEGGWLPQPVVIPPQPVTWNNDVTTFNAGNVNGGSLILGPAERADVVVDFSSYADGTELILYNDAPAPWPALDPHYDYFTGAPDMTEAGGAPPTAAGFGPNTRTVMKIVVKSAAGTGAAFDVDKLKTAFNGTIVTDPPSVFTGNPVFKDGQDDLIVGQANLNPTGDPAKYETYLFDQPYNIITTTYGQSYPSTWPNWGVARINDKELHFYEAPTAAQTWKYRTDDTRVHPQLPSLTLTGGIPLMFKAIQDEQGETFDEYGRMRAGLGIENITPGAQRVNFIIQTYSDPATEILDPTVDNGIQIWKITHNGVDTHPIHFHLYDVQVINRVGWDGFIRLPDPSELGWKDTLRVSPLEDTIVALKPVTPRLPFGVPESYRPLNPARPMDDNTELTQIDPITGNPRVNLNRFENIDWEYVWHCHILSHEENDMMRNQSFKFAETQMAAPSVFTPSISGQDVTFTWTDPTPVNYADYANPAFGTATDGEIRFDVERTTDNWATVDYRGSVLANQTTFTETLPESTLFKYRVLAVNAKFATPSNEVQVIAPGYKIVSTATAGGTIDPPGTNYYQPTLNQTYTITPATDYHIQTITVDGGNVAVADPYAANTYDFNNILANHTIDAVFQINPTVLAPAYMYVQASSSSGNIDLGWGLSNTPGVTYVVQESTNSNFNTITQVYSGPNRSVLLTGKLNGTYYYRVMATKTNWIGSNWVVSPNPCVVGITVGTPAYMYVPANSTSNGTINLSWGISATAGATYVVEESTVSDFSANVTQVYSGLNRNVSLTGRANGTWYYRVKATKTGMTDSAWRTTGNGIVVNVTAVIPTYMYVPAGPNPSKIIGLGWGISSTPGVTYVVEESTAIDYSANLTEVYNGPNRSVNLSGRTSGVSYYYRVKATKPGTNDSAWRNGPNPCVMP